MTSTLRSIGSWSLALLAAFALALALAAPHAYSQTSSTPIAGWMWSDNIGWLSLNCSTDTTGCSGAGGNWGLSMDGSGNVSGYAWSDNVGWVKFGGLSGFPAAGSNAAFSGGNFSGWARACAGTASGDCSSMVARTDGWDGWISLSGTSPAYGVTSGGNSAYSPSISGAWGSDVVGWFGAAVNASCTATPITCIDSSHYSGYTDAQCVVHPGGTCPPSAPICVDGFGCTNSPPTGCLSVNAEVRSPSSCTAAQTSARVASGGTAVLYWEVSSVDTCTLTGPGVSSSGVSGSVTTAAIKTTSTYTLACDSGSVQVATYQVTVATVPVYQER